MMTAHAALRERLYETFRGSPTPLLFSEDRGIPGASLWSGARLWVARLRGLGLVPGDRVVVDLPPSPAHVMVTIAAWWEGLTLCPSGGDGAEVLESLDGRVCVSLCGGPGVLRPMHDGEPDECPAVRARETGAPTPGIAVLFGEVGAWGRGTPAPAFDAASAAVSYDELLSLLSPAAGEGGAWSDGAVLSPRGWESRHGLLVEAWPALASGATLLAEPRGLMEPWRLPAISAGFGRVRLYLTSAEAARLAANREGAALLSRAEVMPVDDATGGGESRACGHPGGWAAGRAGGVMSS